LKEKFEQLEKRIQRISPSDEMTGLQNSHTFFCTLRTEFKRAERYQHPLSIVKIDVSDAQGSHLLGSLSSSYVLSKIGRLIRESIRHEIDVAARVGQDEYLILLPETSLEDAKTVSTRIQLRLMNTTFDNGDHRTNLQASCGLAYFHGQGGTSFIPDPEALVRAAEVNLAHTKDTSSTAS
jgi:diguanylate cyclase (GGDEF)-like protein